MACDTVRPVEHAVLRATPAVVPVVGFWPFSSPVEQAARLAMPAARVEHAVLRATPAVVPVVGF